MVRYLYLIIVFFFIAASCKKKKTIWNSDWSAPIVNDTLTLAKFVNDSTLSVSNSGYYELDLHRTLLDINLTEIVKIPDTTINKTFTIGFSNFNLAPGTNFVNSVEENNMNVQGIELKKVRLSKGTIDIRLENPINTSVIFTIKLPGVTKSGNVLEATYTAPSGSNSNPGVVEGSMDISGYEMDLTGVSGGSFNILQSLFMVKTDPNGISTSMTNQDITKISATLKDVKIDYARGYFGDKIISDTTETAIDILSKVTNGTLDFPSSNLTFKITNGLKIPAKATITVLSNKNNAGNTIPMIMTNQSSFQFGQPFNLDPATGSWNSLVSSETSVNFNSVNSNLEQYLENLGQKHKIGYSIHLNPWGNSSGGWNEIFPNSHLKVTIDASLPLALGLDGLTIKDTFDFDVKQNTEKTHVVSGELILVATNAFPLSGNISLDLIDSEGNILFTINGSEVLQSSIYGTSTSSTGLKTCVSTIHYLLTEEIISKLELIKKVGITSVFNTPNPNTGTNEQVLIPEGAFLGVKLKGGFKIENRY